MEMDRTSRASFPRAIAPLAGLLLALASGPSAQAVTAVSVDGHPAARRAPY